MTAPRLRAFLPVAAVALLALSPAQSAATPDAAQSPAPKDQLPKAADRSDQHHIAADQIPPFMGVFGSADLIAKVGLRGKVGSYIEFQTIKSQKKPAGSGLRIAQVGPEVPGGRWIEITSAGSATSVGLRFLTTGNDRGNVKRLLFAGPQGIPLELPLEMLTTDMPIAMPGGAAGSTLLSDAKYAGHETLTVPLGKFAAEHWIVASEPKRLELWTTRDASVPFTGVIKMVSESETAVAVKVGNDAKATILVPETAH